LWYQKRGHFILCINGTGGYLGEWKREYDKLETHMADIHKIPVTKKSIIEPMRTTREVISYDDILIKGAQLARIPLNHDEPVNTKTIGCFGEGVNYLSRNNL
jgi:hypothetical protein